MKTFIDLNKFFIKESRSYAGPQPWYKYIRAYIRFMYYSYK